MSDTTQEILKLCQELKAENKLLFEQNKAMLEALGIKQFVRPSGSEAKAKAQAKAKADAKAKAEAEAEPPTLSELYKKGKASLKRRGLKQEFYHKLVAFTKGETLQGDDYKQAYVDCFNVTGYGAL